MTDPASPPPGDTAGSGKGEQDPNGAGPGRAVAAEHLRERVYGTVSVLAVLAALLFGEQHSAGDAIVSVVLTVGSLWAASMFADITGHLAAHQNWPARRELLLLFSSRSQILACGTVPVLLLAGAAFGWWHLHTALLWSAWTQVATLGLVGYLAVRGTSLKVVVRVAVVAAEVGLGLVIVGVKFLAH